MRSTRVALALLVLMAPILGVVAVQPASAQTYSHTFDGVGETRFVGFDVGDHQATTILVEVSTTDGPGGNNLTLYREETSVTSLQKGTSVTVIENAGAYDDLRISIEGLSSKPKWGVGSDFGEVEFRARDQLFTTGGDRDLTPTTGDYLSMAVNPPCSILRRPQVISESGTRVGPITPKQARAIRGYSGGWQRQHH
mgnify:CR=1 FL=1